MTIGNTKTFPSILAELPAMLQFVCKQAKEYGMDRGSLKHIELVSEEALVNILSYAYPKNKHGEITIACSQSTEGKGIVIEIRDKGIPFNPVKEKVVSPKDLSLNERPIGGLGRFFITKLMDKVSYQRKGDTNILKLLKLTR